jgi:hypothetical protein
VGRLVPQLPERSVRSDGVSVATRTTTDRTDTMYAYCLLLAAFIYSAFPPFAPRHRDLAPTNVVAIVDRVHSEILDVLGLRARDADATSVVAARLGPRLTRGSVRPATTEPDVLQPTLRRGSRCWWLWLLSGADVCG